MQGEVLQWARRGGCGLSVGGESISLLRGHSPTLALQRQGGEGVFGRAEEGAAQVGALGRGVADDQAVAGALGQGLRGFRRAAALDQSLGGSWF